MRGSHSKRVACSGFLVLLAMWSLVSVASAESAQSGAGGPAVSARMVGIIVKLQDDSVVSYRGTVTDLPATSAQDTGAARIDRAARAVQEYRAHVAQRHAAFEAAARAAIPDARVTYRYDVVLGGVAMQVPEDQVRRVAQLPGVKAVYRDRMLHLHTDTSPRFIGAGTVWAQLQGQERAGEGIVVGVLDTGVWPEHPSFSDPDGKGKPYSPPPIAPGACDFTGGVNPGPSFTCNHKLIGAYRFMAAYDQCVADGFCNSSDDFTTARDSEGHGTHTASTAAGNAAVAAEIFGIDRKDISGVAPRAHVIAYKVCGPEGCLSSDAVAAIQQAILDGVDVINFSISGGTDPYNDVVELAFRDAYAAGVFVAASAGNEGPDADTVNHRGPWVTAVAASTESREFVSTLTLVSADRARLKLAGASITPGLLTPSPIIVAASLADPFCAATSPASSFTGMIVVCARGGVARIEKSFNVAQRGAVGMILYNTSDFEELETDNHSIPSMQITKADADALFSFLAAHPSVTATFPSGAAKRAQEDVIASFSSRGGTLIPIGINKPDITAPGVQILAGHTPEPLGPAEPQGQLFQAIAGTSMSSPHIAGAAALLKNLHPAWTPGQIKSALMTTASTRYLVTEDGETPFTPFDAGSGRVDLHNAQTPGLTFDVPVSDYVDHASDLWTVNHPSIYIPDTAPDVMTVQRTPRNLLPRDSVWQLTVVPDQTPGLTVTVSSTVSVPAGGSAPFDIQIDKTGIPPGEARHAIVQLSQGSFALHMPISAAGPVARPDLIVTSVSAPTTGTRGSPMFTSVTIENAGSAAATGFYFQVYLSKDDAQISIDDTFYWFCDIGSLAPTASTFCDASFDVPSSIPAGTYFLVVRVDEGGVVIESNENNNIDSAGPIAVN